MTRIEDEKHVVTKMIEIYCRHKEGNRSLCPDCVALVEYARQRLDHCPHGNRKPTCRKCTIHCYNLEMQNKMRRVMRYVGPRMLLYSPLQAINHLIRDLTHKN